MKTELSVVLPCYNESGNIPAILERFSAIARELRLELILVDNGSTDGSGEILERELRKAEYSYARSVRIEKNIGYGHGIRFGLQHCRSEVVGFSHADLQCPPEDVLRGYRFYKDLAREGAILVKGRRTNRSGTEAFISRSYSALSRWLLGLPPVDVNGQPKLFARGLVGALQNGPDDFSFDLFVLYQAVRSGVRIVEYDVSFDMRRHGQSKWAYSPISRIRGILRAIGQMGRMRWNFP